MAAEELQMARMEGMRAGPGGHAGESTMNEQPCASVPLHHRTAQTTEEATTAMDADFERRMEEARAFNAADSRRREDQLRQEKEG